ncbi:MAG: hypothetical protein MZV70_53240 [Desulfobacterales bacterium]|nr:hypothetical protein [Desulfobacterales bacterium]
MDLNGDGTLEIVIQTFGAGCFIYIVPGSAENLLLWPTGRGNYLRDFLPTLDTSTEAIFLKSDSVVAAEITTL